VTNLYTNYKLSNELPNACRYDTDWYTILVLTTGSVSFTTVSDKVSE